jgi:hypothetical protein|tara:strand:- start:2400 stop:2816 length:417 start_codon:yes stop_codon:yes gene_type:complete
MVTYARFYNHAFKHKNNMMSFVRKKLKTFSQNPVAKVRLPKHIYTLVTTQAMCRAQPEIYTLYQWDIMWSIRLTRVIENAMAQKILRWARHVLYRPGGAFFGRMEASFTSMAQHHTRGAAAKATPLMEHKAAGQGLYC